MPSAPVLTAIGVAIVLAIVLAMVFAIKRAPMLPKYMESQPGPDDDQVGFVDPWDYQRNLMAVSDQRMPGLPTLSKGSILYYTLILEESAETGAALLAAVRRTFPGPGERSHDEHIIAGKLTSVISRMEESATLMKAALKSMPDFAFTLTRAEAIELLDGTTDIQVVNSGFALASGLPGQEGYVEVVSSNLSKVNPATGKIDKSMDGKWLKGPNYVMPNLERVLQQHLESRARSIREDMAREEANETARLAREADRVAGSNG